MAMKACVRCGSADLALPSAQDGFVPGAAEAAGLYACRACGWRGLPLEFDDPGSLRAYQKARRADGEGKPGTPPGRAPL